MELNGSECEGKRSERPSRLVIVTMAMAHSPRHGTELNVLSFIII